jgi:CTP synthase
LRGIGIQPDVIVARSDHEVTEDLRAKISLFTDVPKQAVVPLLTLDTIYAVPQELEVAGLGRLVMEHFGLENETPDLSAWGRIVERIRAPKTTVRVAIVGKYIELHDAYKSVTEALLHAGLDNEVEVEVCWFDSEDLERGRGREALADMDGIVIPGGFGHRGIEGKIIAARCARENKIPYLGLCLGLQVLVIELARHVLESDEPNSTEFDHTTKHPVIDLLPEQVDVTDMGGTMRLGTWPCRVDAGTLAGRAYGTELIHERHRHRFEVNPSYLPQLESGGLVVSGRYTERDLVDIAELREDLHPFMVGSQFHPEFKSRPLTPHPLFRAFVAASALRHRSQEASLRSEPGVSADADGAGLNGHTNGHGSLGSAVDATEVGEKAGN